MRPLGAVAFVTSANLSSIELLAQWLNAGSADTGPRASRSGLKPPRSRVNAPHELQYTTLAGDAYRRQRFWLILALTPTAEKQHHLPHDIGLIHDRDFA